MTIGCGEGRVARELFKRGHAVTGIDASVTLVEAARAGDPPIDAIHADAAHLPLDRGSADLAWTKTPCFLHLRAQRRP